jgi:hypothetical protein
MNARQLSPAPDVRSVAVVFIDENGDGVSVRRRVLKKPGGKPPASH